MIQLEKKDYALIALIILFAGYIALSYFEDAQAQEEKKDYSWTTRISEERAENDTKIQKMDDEIKFLTHEKSLLEERNKQITCKLSS